MKQIQTLEEAKAEIIRWKRIAIRRKIILNLQKREKEREIEMARLVEKYHKENAITVDDLKFKH